MTTMTALLSILVFDSRIPEIKQYKIQKLKLIEPDQDELNLPDVNYNSIINIPSSDFRNLSATFQTFLRNLKLNLYKTP